MVILAMGAPADVVLHLSRIAPGAQQQVRRRMLDVDGP
jgi:hypothetical protein